MVYELGFIFSTSPNLCQLYICSVSLPYLIIKFHISWHLIYEENKKLGCSLKEVINKFQCSKS